MSFTLPIAGRFARRLVLHTWTLESTPLFDALYIARDACWNAVEIPRSDKCYRAGQAAVVYVRHIAHGDLAKYIRFQAISACVAG
ncbi:MAG: hypothetical protein OEW79_06340 [Betaproteobacteria bacterium]|jgi:hypothetical protein|nr:hypothetical protein [Betaproteobacteria bacterium]MDH4293769.1 hypothetical protein [Betaproteobacteria bacterium]MDH5342437.1 hypothetical protein [Betaproteobacteria bacterium]